MVKRIKCTVIRSVPGRAQPGPAKAGNNKALAKNVQAGFSQGCYISLANESSGVESADYQPPRPASLHKHRAETPPAFFFDVLA